MMLPKRVIPCLDVDGGRVVKGTEFVDIQDMGDPVELARRYEAEGADELAFLDISATAERRSTMVDTVRRTASQVFIPLTVGGGVRSETDAQTLLDAGADKIAVNSAALRDPSIVNRLAARFGRQCVVLAVDARQKQDGWEAYAAGGRVPTGIDAVGWTREATLRGAGEILLTSIDRDGTGKGYDIGLTGAVAEAVDVPVIASGGAGRLESYTQAINVGGADAVLAASEFHTGRQTVSQVKAALRDDGIAVRSVYAPRELFRLRPSKNHVIAIADYGTGNRYSLMQALKQVGAKPFVTADPDELDRADGIVLPGVGAYGSVMDSMRQTGLDSTLKSLASIGKPILGICIGNQLLFEGSEEGGRHAGLGLLPGRVTRIETPRRPNIGWCSLELERADAIFNAIPQVSQSFYHAHEYAAQPGGPVWTLADTALPHGDDPAYKVSSVLKYGNVYGVQFHPEKSSFYGLQLLRNFVDITVAANTEL